MPWPCMRKEATPEKMQPEGELSVGTSLPYLAGQLVTWLGFKGVRKKLARVPTSSQGLPWVRGNCVANKHFPKTLSQQY